MERPVTSVGPGPSVHSRPAAVGHDQKGIPMRVSHGVGRGGLRALGATGLLATLALAACSSSSSTPKAGSAASALGTLKAGVIKVAIEPYAPYTSMQGSKMVGLDADIL